MQQDGERERRADVFGSRFQASGACGRRRRPPVELRRLFASLERVDFGEDFAHQATGVEEFEGRDASRAGENGRPSSSRMRSALTAWISGAFGANGFPGGGLELEPKVGGETDGPQQAEPVFVKAPGGIADGAQDSGGEVFAAVDVSR